MSLLLTTPPAVAPRRPWLAAFFLAVILTLTLAAPVMASGDNVVTGTPSGADNSLIGRLSPECRLKGNCNFCDVLDGFTILTRWILGVCGVIALLFFIRFGLMFIISGGNSATVDKAKKGLVGTVIGLVIIFSAWEIVNLTIYTIITPTGSSNLGNRATLSSVMLFGSGPSWHEYCANRPAADQGRIPGVTD